VGHVTAASNDTTRGEMLVWVFVCIALIGTPAFAGWQRYVDSLKGGFIDSPPPHPLAYFQVDPCLRPESDPLGRALECTWPGAPPPSPEELTRRASTRTELFEVGKIGAFTIYDLWYTRGFGPSPNERDFKSVLVWTARDRFYEIDTNIRRGYEFPNEEIRTVDGQQILVVRSHDGGNDRWISERLYMFRPAGPADFIAVYQAASKLMPANMGMLTMHNDYASMTYLVETYRKDLNLPPASVQERGRITVDYRFVDGRAIVIRSKYEPYLLGNSPLR
jgi:hypothetical protein